MNIMANLDQLKVFFYAAKYQNITKAAQELFLTQPAATRSLHLLEAQLESQLFIRSTRGVSLTMEGELLYQQLIPAFECIASAEEKLRQVHSLESGFIHIAINNLASEYIIKKYIEDFSLAYPSIAITVSRINTKHLAESLENGWIDLAVIWDIGEDHSPDDIISETIFSKNIFSKCIGIFTDVLLVGDRYAHMAGRSVSVSELAGLPFIVPITRRDTVLYYLKKFRNSEEPSGIDLPVNGAQSRIQLAIHNQGFTYFPAEFVTAPLESHQLHIINTDVPMRTNSLHIFSTKSSLQNIATKKLADILLNLQF